MAPALARQMSQNNIMISCVPGLWKDHHAHPQLMQSLLVPRLFGVGDLIRCFEGALQTALSTSLVLMGPGLALLEVAFHYHLRGSINYLKSRDIYLPKTHLWV